MTATVFDTSPLPGALVGSGEPLRVTMTLDPGTTGRAFTVTLNGVDVVTWVGGILTVNPSYAADFSEASNALTVYLTRTGGWVVGTEYMWSTAYSDSAGAGESPYGSFAHVPYTASLHPEPNQAAVSPRAPVTVLVDFAAGDGLGVDVTISDVPAVTEGAFNLPDFSGRSGGVGTQGWSFVSSRRAFGWGQHVAVRASVRVDISGRVYSDTFSWLFDVAERPPSPRWTGAPALSPALDEHPVVVALRQIASATLLTRGASPPVVTVLADLALHSEVGQLLKPLLRDSGPDLFAEDTPSDADLRSFVSRADPFWRTALALMAPPEEVEALQRAWGSDHTVEQAGALAVLLCHSWWRHGD